MDYNNSVVYQYNWDADKFVVKSKQSLMNLWDKVYFNSYGRNYSFSEIVRKLNHINSTDLKNYDVYNEFNRKEFDLVVLNNLTKILLKSNAERKKDINPVYWDVKEQIQQLINSDVFFDNGKFYLYNGRQFAYISDLMQVFKNMPNLNNLSSFGLKYNKGIFAKYLTNGKGVISDWMEYDLKQRRMEETSESYHRIRSLISTFE